MPAKTTPDNTPDETPEVATPEITTTEPVVETPEEATPEEVQKVVPEDESVEKVEAVVEPTVVPSFNKGGVGIQES